MKSLVIVESPAKAKTISKYLGKNYIVKASMGHIKDLPKSKLGVDENTFEATFRIIKDKIKIVNELKKLSSNTSTIYLATDPDREGEAISHHIAEILKNDSNKIYRILLHEITEKAVKEAINNPSVINQNKVNAQYTRRVLDRLVGYKISPLLWKKVKTGLSAGRVQSVALRLICEREKEIKAFIPEEYWIIDAVLASNTPPEFNARLIKKNNKNIKIKNAEEANAIEKDLEKNDYIVKNVSKQYKQKQPPPPFITSRLQQEAVRKLKCSVSKIMQIAQRLYEGVNLGSGERVGLITYMRTDSVRVSDAAIKEARSFINNNYGSKYLPAKIPVYKNKKTTQDAHEAIRPTSVLRTPDSIKNYLSKDEFLLYEMIWQRFVASQMNPYKYLETKVDIQNGEYLFQTKGHTPVFDGYLKIYKEDILENQQDASEKAPLNQLPLLQIGEKLKLIRLNKEQKFTQPPPRYTEATLVKELEEKEIGRPSTYATILQILQNRNYVIKKEGKFYPTDLGMVVVDLLVKYFQDLMDVKYTAEMENKLDDIEEGKNNKFEVLNNFYQVLSKELQNAYENMQNVKSEGILTNYQCLSCKSKLALKSGRYGIYYECTNNDCKKRFNNPNQENETSETNEICPKCNSKMVIKKSKYGKFLACINYPNCKTTKSINAGKDFGVCPECNSKLVQRRSKYGTFIACSNYPNCKYIAGKEKIKCPVENCDGYLVRRKSKKGKYFYGCSNYPKCSYTSWEKPKTNKS
jgi:DNA topoisomerase-1